MKRRIRLMELVGVEVKKEVRTVSEMKWLLRSQDNMVARVAARLAREKENVIRIA